MPSKSWQYLRTGRPILALLDCGDGVIRAALRSAPQAHLAERGDADRIAEIVARLAAAPRGQPCAPSEAVTAFSRRNIARRFAEVLEAACARHAARAVHHDGGARREGPRLADAVAPGARP